MTLQTVDHVANNIGPSTLTQDTDSWAGMLPAVVDLARNVADTDFVPKALRGNAAAVSAAILSGREIGLPPMTALQVTHVIEGKPGLSAEGMRALVFAAGHQIEFVESTGATCTVRGRRRYAETWTEVTWSLDMARAANLAGRPIWRTYPRTQLQARATTELCRMIFPDVIHGFRSVEELEDMGDTDGTDAANPAANPGSSPVSRTPARRRTKAKTPTLAKASEEAASGPPLAPPPPLPELAPSGGGGIEPAPGAPTRGGEGGDPTSVRKPSPSPRRPAPPRSEDQALLPELEPDRPPVAPSPERDPDGPVNDAQKRALHAFFNTLGLKGLTDRPERLRIASGVIGRQITTTNDLTFAEAGVLLDTLSRLPSHEALSELLAQIDAEAARADHKEEEE